MVCVWWTENQQNTHRATASRVSVPSTPSSFLESKQCFPISFLGGLWQTRHTHSLSLFFFFFLSFSLSSPLFHLLVLLLSFLPLFPSFPLSLFLLFLSSCPPLSLFLTLSLLSPSFCCPAFSCVCVLSRFPSFHFLYIVRLMGCFMIPPASEAIVRASHTKTSHTGIDLERRIRSIALSRQLSLITPSAIS